MQATVNVKLVNSKFNQAYADKDNEGEETEDNIKYLWEDEFDIKGNVKNFKVINNTTYELKGVFDNNKEFCFKIPDITILEFTMEDGSKTLLPFSKKAISKTSKVETKNGFYFNVNLKSIKEIVNPMDGVYIIKDDYPKELLAYLPEEDDDDADEEE